MKDGNERIRLSDMVVEKLDEIIAMLESSIPAAHLAMGYQQACGRCKGCSGSCEGSCRTGCDNCVLRLM